MSNYFTKERVDSVGAVTLTGTTAVAFAAGHPIDVQDFVFVATTAVTAASTVNIVVRNVDDSSSTTIGSIVIPTLALNAVAHVGVSKPSDTGSTGADGSLVFKGYEPGGPIQVNPGQEIALVPVANGAAGVVAAYVGYLPQGFSGARVADAVEATYTPA